MIFVSTMIYASGKQLGFELAVAEFHRQLCTPSASSLPVVRSIARLQELEEVQLMIDPAATSIAKARCRAFHAAARSSADVWISIDDDCEATVDTFDLLIQAARTGGDVIIAPCLLRGQDRTNVALFKLELERQLIDGARLKRAHFGGFGIAAVSRHAMNRLTDKYSPELEYRDHDQVQRLALFSEQLACGQWVGEDLAFCARATAAGLTIEALATGVTMHDGQGLLLAELDLHPSLELERMPAFEQALRPYSPPTVTDVDPLEFAKQFG